MESKRILLSDKHFHTVELSEQSMGIICHALNVLAMAFDMEPQYKEAIKQAHGSVAALLQSDGTLLIRATGVHG